MIHSSSDSRRYCPIDSRPPCLLRSLTHSLLFLMDPLVCNKCNSSNGSTPISAPPNSRHSNASQISPSAFRITPSLRGFRWPGTTQVQLKLLNPFLSISLESHLALWQLLLSDECDLTSNNSRARSSLSSTSRLLNETAAQLTPPLTRCYLLHFFQAIIFAVQSSLCEGRRGED